jgi:hypothetical protein
MPDGSDKTLRVDGRFDVLHELKRFEDLTKDGRAGVSFSNKQCFIHGVFGKTKEKTE